MALNDASARSRQGDGGWHFQPAVKPIPANMPARGEEYPKAVARGPVTIDGTEVTYEYVEAQGAMLRARYVYRNRDRTFFRDVELPDLDYQEVEPLLYGPATHKIPQVSAAFEADKLGTGNLTWLAIDSTVEGQLVNEDDEVVHTFYRGNILAYAVDGDDLVVQIGGQVAGYAAYQSQKAPLSHGRADIGRLMARAFESMRVPFRPRLGPVTGILMGRFGDMKMIDYIPAVLARGSTRSGNQYTVMPNDLGNYHMFRKDLETVHFTLYVDEEDTKATLRRDRSLEVTRTYGKGVTPGGTRVLNGIYPNVFEGQDPPYPMDDNSTFGLGTTNDDVDSNAGISVMLVSLHAAGLIDKLDVDSGVYNDAAVKAVKTLQKKAGILPVTGNMNPATWRALHNIGKIGSTLNWAKIMPMAWDPRTERWLRTADGSPRAKHLGYDRKVPLVDADLDFESGLTKAQMLEFADLYHERAQTIQLVGSITLNLGGLIEGDHTWGDPITVVDHRQAHTGKNVKVIGSLCGPEGRIMHISGKTVSGGIATLTVDTMGRDTRAAYEIVKANKAAREDPALIWWQQQRASKTIHDIVEHDEMGGLVQPVAVTGHQWKVFRVVMGEIGLVEQFKIRTVDDPASFVVAVFGLPIGRNRLAAACPNPLADKSGWKVSAIRDKLDAEHRLLYLAGEPDAPCGWFPSSLADETETTSTSRDVADIETTDGSADIVFPSGALTSGDEGHHISGSGIPADTTIVDVTSSTTATISNDATTTGTKDVTVSNSVTTVGDPTGRWEDDAGFPYRTGDNVVVYVAVYADRDCKVRGGDNGRMFWNQEIRGS